MPSIILQPLRSGACPTFLTIGHVTRDLVAEDAFTLGGTVTFAALTASRLGLTSALATCADEALLAELPTHLPRIGVAARVTSTTTTFENSYADGFRVQYLRARASHLEYTDIPSSWLDASLILLAPLAQEIPLELVRALPRRPGSLLAATPQGWLRRWDAEGRVWPTPWEHAADILPLLDVLILSHDDLLPFANGQRATADAMLSAWSMHVPMLVATDGRSGATLFERGVSTRFVAYPAAEVDPTGAGDVFAAAFLAHFFQHRVARAAMDFANCAASISIEHRGITGIPTPEQIQSRLRPTA